MLNIGQIVKLHTPKEKNATSPAIYIGQQIVDSQVRQRFYTAYNKIYWTDNVESGYTFLFLDDKFYKSPLQIGTVSKTLTEKDITKHEARFLKILNHVTTKMYEEDNKSKW